MAKVLIGRHFSGADIDRKIVKLRKSVVPGADAKKPAAISRPALSFRAVNRPAAPGYDPALQRHHLLPQQLLSQRCFGAFFERVGRERLGFDDFRSNGLLLPANDAAALRIGLPLHRGPHRKYNAMVSEHVGQVEARWSSVRLHSPQAALGDAVASMQLLQRALRRRLLDPGVNRLALNRFDPLGHGVDFTQVDAMVDSLWPDNNLWAEESRSEIDQAPALMAANPAQATNLAPKMAGSC